MRYQDLASKFRTRYATISPPRRKEIRTYIHTPTYANTDYVCMYANH